MTVEFDKFGYEVVRAGARQRRMSVDDLLGEAALYCLADCESGRPVWRVPAFGRPARALGLSLTLCLSDEDWDALEAEAARRDVSVEALLHHAALCLLAEQDQAALAN